MRRWLLDTNILSEIRKPKPQPKVIDFVRQQPIETLFVSTITFAELRYGIEVLDDAERRAELNDWLTLKVRPMFAGRVLEVSEDVMFKWRLLVDVGRKTRSYVHSTRSDYRRNGHRSWHDGRHEGYLGLPAHSSLAIQSLAGAHPLLKGF